jgi:hypothetical protein
MLLPYNPSDFAPLSDPLSSPGIYLRYASVEQINPDNNTINIKWLDHPSGRDNLFLAHPGHGIFELPAPGAVVIVCFDAGYRPYIVGYLPVGYRDLVGTPRYINGKLFAPKDRIRKLKIGEKLLVSYLDNSQRKESEIATTTGSEFFMSNTGDITMSNWAGEYWNFSAKKNIIEQQSLNSRIITEAGILDFGLIKRDFPMGVTPDSTISDYVGKSEDTIPPTLHRLIPGEPALTEFKLCILETADTNPATAPEVDNPFIEITLGTKVKKIGTGTVATYALDTTDQSHAVPDKEIMIQIKTKADQGFEFTVDKDGNLTVKVKHDVKFVIGGDSNIDVFGTATVNCKDIKLGGSGNEKAVVLSDFIGKFNTHTHELLGAGTKTPTLPILVKSVTSSSVRVD